VEEEEGGFVGVGGDVDVAVSGAGGELYGFGVFRESHCCHLGGVVGLEKGLV